MIWPRLLYWLSFGLMILAGLGALGILDVTAADEFYRPLHALLLSVFALVLLATVGMMLGKVWMDKIARRRSSTRP